ncbi:hypothetical protein SARC_15198, partial [Sphaeroforma arctica JP610]
TEVLKVCDRYRDDVLPELGIRIEDKPNERAVVKLVDPQELRKEREREELERAAKEEKKAAQRKAQ